MTQSLSRFPAVEDLIKFSTRYPNLLFSIEMCDDDDGWRPCLVLTHSETSIRNPLFCEGHIVEVDPTVEYGIARDDAEEIAALNGY